MKRRCSRCGRRLPLTAFGRDRSKPLGRAYTCVRCGRAYARALALRRRLGLPPLSSLRVPMAQRRKRPCRGCGRVLPVSEFTRDCRTGAPVARCNACRRTKDRQYYRRHCRRMRAKARRTRLMNKAKGIVCRKSPEARRRNAARLMVFWAVRAGTLVRPTRCERCGARPPRRLLHGHHPDYSKPLDVVWLCSACHGREHWVTRNAERGMRNEDKTGNRKPQTGITSGPT